MITEQIKREQWSLNERIWGKKSVKRNIKWGSR
jgi:hypothetical protein